MLPVEEAAGEEAPGEEALWFQLLFSVLPLVPAAPSVSSMGV